MSSTNDSIFQKLLKGGTILVFGLVLEMGISFVGKLLIARYLGAASFGGVSLGVTTFTIASTVLVFGLDTGIARYLPRKGEDSYRRGVLLSGFQIGLTVPFVFGILMVIFAGRISTSVFGDPSIAQVFRIVGLTIPLAAFVNLSVGVIQGDQKATPKVVIQNFALPVTRFGGFGFAIILGFGVVGITGAYLVSYLIGAAICVYYLRVRTNLFSGPKPIYQYRKLLAFSLPLAISGIGSKIFSNADIILLGFFKQTTAVGVYSAVYPVSQLVMFGLSSFAFIFMPIFSELHANQATNQMMRVYQIATKWTLFVTFPAVVFIFLFPELVIKLTFGPEYMSGAPALSVLVFAFGAHALMGPNAQALTATGQTRLVMYASIGAAALNLVLNLVLIPHLSFLGAAIATTTSYICMNALLNGLLYRQNGIHPFTTGQLAPVIVMSTVIGVFSVFFSPEIESKLLGAGILMLLILFVYPMVVLRYGGFGETESMLLADIEERFGVDLSTIRLIITKISRSGFSDRPNQRK